MTFPDRTALPLEVDTICGCRVWRPGFLHPRDGARGLVACACPMRRPYRSLPSPPSRGEFVRRRRRGRVRGQGRSPPLRPRPIGLWRPDAAAHAWTRSCPPVPRCGAPPRCSTSGFTRAALFDPPYSWPPFTGICCSQRATYRPSTARLDRVADRAQSHALRRNHHLVTALTHAAPDLDPRAIKAPH